MSERFTLGPAVDALLDRLHSTSTAQDQALWTYFSARATDDSMKSREFDQETNDFLRDKLVALERPKAQFCYQVCRALQARRVVEAGTSFGVSTLYLASAVRDNGGGKVIGTEYEPEKARAALQNFAEAGLSDLIELRQGDLRETLKDVQGPIDFMLIDIWVPMARPALERIAPLLRPGAVVICDNTEQFRDLYADYFEFISDERNGLRTMTLPFDGGLEFTVRV